MTQWDLSEPKRKRAFMNAQQKQFAPPSQRTACGNGVPFGWVQFIDGVQTQNFARDEDELNTIKSISAISAAGSKVEYVPVYAAQPKPMPKAVAQADGNWVHTAIKKSTSDTRAIFDEPRNHIQQAIDSMAVVLGQELRAVFTNNGSHAENTSHLNCPHCGGSGHKDDVTPNPDAKDVYATESSELLDWLDGHGHVTYSFEAASITFEVPDQFEGNNTVQDVIRAGRTAQETKESTK